MKKKASELEAAEESAASVILSILQKREKCLWCCLNPGILRFLQRVFLVSAGEFLLASRV